MSNEEYIASGILELYAAGGLNQAERGEVELRAENSPEVRAALEEACSAMEHYAQLYAVSPGPALKARVLSSIQDETKKSADSSQSQHQEPIALYSTQTDISTPYPQAETHTPYKWLLAASVGLFLISGVLSFFFYNKWQQAEKQLAVVAASEQLMARNAETVSLQTRQLEEALAVMRNPDFKSIRLESVKANTDANLMVYWNAQQQQVYLDCIKIPAPPEGMQYQLWALDNGKPVDAGMLALQQEVNYLQQMKPIRAAQAFAITLEPLGGSESPTLEQLMVMGEVKA